MFPLAQASYHFLKIRTVLLWEKLACSTRWKKNILIQEINLETMCERPVGSLPQCGCGCRGLGLLVNSYRQSDMHWIPECARGGWREIGWSPGHLRASGCVILYFFKCRLNRASAISWMRLPSAALAGSRSSRWSVSQQACTYEESAARRRVLRFWQAC